MTSGPVGRRSFLEDVSISTHGTAGYKCFAEAPRSRTVTKLLLARPQVKSPLKNVYQRCPLARLAIPRNVAQHGAEEFEDMMTDINTRHHQDFRRCMRNYKRLRHTESQVILSDPGRATGEGRLLSQESRRSMLFSFTRFLVQYP